MAEALSSRWGQEVIVDNRTGGAGFVAATAVKRSDPDGHTLFVADTGVMVINPFLFNDVPYDPKADFTPITMISDTPLVLVANSKAPFNNIEEFVNYARANPGTLSFGSAGIGSLNHIVPEWINYEAGIDVQHIAYRESLPGCNGSGVG